MRPAGPGLRVLAVLLLAGLLILGFGWLWSNGWLRRDATFSGRTAVLEPLGACWTLIGLGGVLEYFGVPRALVVPLWFIGFAVADWGLVIALVSPDWHKRRWLVLEERAVGLRPWPRWNRFWLIATLLVGLLVLLFAGVMLAMALSGELSVSSSMPPTPRQSSSTFRSSDTLSQR